MSKSSAVAEMGDHLATIDIGRKVGGYSAPFRGGSCVPIKKCRLGRGLPPYQVVSWSIQMIGHNIHGPKIGGRGCAPLGSWVPI